MSKTLQINVTKELYALAAAGRVNQFFIPISEKSTERVKECDGTVTIVTVGSKPLVRKYLRSQEVNPGYRPKGYPPDMSVRYPSLRIFTDMITGEEKESKSASKPAEKKDEKAVKK